MSDSDQPPITLHIVAPASTFDDLYATHFTEMVRLATLLVSQREAARDIVQDAFVALHPKWFAVRNPAGYLRTAVVNGCRSYHRRQSRGKRAMERRGPDTASVDLAVDHTLSALDALPYRQRAALVLRYYEQRSEAEIAETLGCRPGTVGSLISRGLAAMRKELS